MEYIIELTDHLYFKNFNEEEKNEEPLFSAKYVYLHCAVLCDVFLYDANGLVKGGCRSISFGKRT